MQSRFRNAGAVTLAVAMLIGGWASSASAQCSSWGPVENLSNRYERYEGAPAMVIDPSGHAHIVWDDWNTGTTYYFYTNNVSGSWATPTTLPYTTSGKPSGAEMVLTPDGVLHAFIGKDDIFECTKSISGGSWSTPQQINTLTSGGWVNNAVVDAYGGIYLMYTHLFDSSAPVNSGIYGRYKPLGGAWSATDIIHGTNHEHNWASGGRVTVAVDGTTLWATYFFNDPYDGGRPTINFYKQRPYGGSWTPGGNGAEAPAGVKYEYLAVSPDGTKMATVWATDVDGDSYGLWFEVFAAFSYNGGASWTSATNISNMVHLDRSPKATFDSNNNLHVVWEGFHGAGGHVDYRGHIGGAWGDRITLFGNADVYGSPPHQITNDGNEIHLTFGADTDGTPWNGNYYDAFYMNLPPPTQPKLNLSTHAFSHTTWIRTTEAPDSFTVGNGCTGTLSYSITDNQPWIQVSPSSGASVLDVDTITVTYNGSENLSAGTHTGTITVSGNGFDAPQQISVTLTVRTVTPDFDGDADVDQDDFGHLQACMTGSAVPQEDPDCLDARLDYDGTYQGDRDVDADDLAILMGCVSSAGVPANPSCDD